MQRLESTWPSRGQDRTEESLPRRIRPERAAQIVPLAGRFQNQSIPRRPSPSPPVPEFVRGSDQHRAVLAFSPISPRQPHLESVCPNLLPEEALPGLAPSCTRSWHPSRV